MLAYEKGWIMLKQNGFTLIELVVVVALVGILASVAIPNLTSFIANVKAQTNAEQMYSGVQKARALAISSSNRVSVIYEPAQNTWVIVKSNGKSDAKSVSFNAGTRTWVVVPDDIFVEQYVGRVGESTITATPAGNKVATFNSLGLKADNDGDYLGGYSGTPTITQLSFVPTDPSALLRYNIMITNGDIRLCEPNRPAGDSRKC